MAHDTVAIVTRWFERLQQGDPAPELCDPEIEIRNWDEAPITGPYFGHDGVRQWWSDVAEAFDDVRFALDRIDPIDEDRALTIQRLVGNFRATGIPVEGGWAAIVTVRDGRILSALGYSSVRGARRAAGL